MASKLKKMLVRRLIACVVLTAGAALFYHPTPAAGTMDIEPSPADVISSIHGCWSGMAPADMTGKIPGHVVVTTATGQTVYSAKLVSPAMEQLWNGKDAGLTIHAWCR